MELLVVIGIIAVLIGILLPTLAAAREQAKIAQCSSNQRQLATALVMYSTDNKGWLPGSDTYGPLAAGFSDPTKYTGAYIGWVDGGPGGAQVVTVASPGMAVGDQIGNTELAITNGSLYKYIKNIALYRCPGEIFDKRRRSYSMNSYFRPQDNSWPMVNSYMVLKIAQIKRSAECIAFTEEPDPRYDWNVNGFYADPYAEPTAYPDGSGASMQYHWEDVVGSWHRGGACFSFADGHAEYWRWKSKGTVDYDRNAIANHWPTWQYIQPNGSDTSDLDRVKRGIATWDKKRM